MAVLTEQEQQATRLLLSALIGFLAAEAPMDEQSFPLMMELSELHGRGKRRWLPGCSR